MNLESKFTGKRRRRLCLTTCLSLDFIAMWAKTLKWLVPLSGGSLLLLWIGLRYTFTNLNFEKSPSKYFLILTLVYRKSFLNNFHRYLRAILLKRAGIRAQKLPQIEAKILHWDVTASFVQNYSNLCGHIKSHPLFLTFMHCPTASLVPIIIRYDSTSPNIDILYYQFLLNICLQDSQFDSIFPI